MDEFRFIDWIRGQTETDPDRVPVGPGDDCAMLAGGVLITTDQCADGVHFVLSECGGERAGYKVMARSLSDIAAMGGEPTAAVATVALPRGIGEEGARAIYHGLRRAGDAFGCPVVGGDVAAWEHPLLLTVTMLGRPAGKAPLLRSGARGGDAVCVTGTLGGSLTSGKHLDFTPRVREGAVLGRDWPVHAMIDISDGLAADLGHICRASGVGAQLRAEAIPISPAAARAADPLAAAMGDGEDYELLFTLPAPAADDLLARQPLGTPVAQIGTIVTGEAIELLDAAGGVTPVRPRGFRHQA